MYESLIKRNYGMSSGFTW